MTRQLDFRLRHAATELESTAFIEVGPGKYAGKHWQPGFVFVWEDAFGMAEGILARHLPAYSHFGMNDIPKVVGLELIADWRMAAVELPGLGADDAHRLLNLEATYGTRLDAEVMTYREEIAGMLRELANSCERFYERSHWVCVLGV